MPSPAFQTDAFVHRLTQMLETRQMSQSQLAAALGVSRSTVTGWVRHQKLPDAYLIYSLCQVLDCSADWLLGLASQVEKRDASGGIRWTEHRSAFVSEDQQRQLADGLRFFQQVMSGETVVKDRSQWPMIRAALQAAFRSGLIQLTQVSRHATYEARLKTLFPSLRDVIVADIPTHVLETVIRTELVAFLACTELLNTLTRPQALGLGSGYTMLRLCEQSLASVDQFSGTAWIPLLAFEPSNVEDYTANMLARLMSIRHAGSHALYLPHPDECTTPEMRLIYQETVQRMRNVQTIFLSASGADRRHPSGEAHLLAQFRSADYISEAPELREQYADLQDKDRFGAEILRYLIDSTGQILGRDHSVGHQADLNILRYVSTTMGRVCLVAASGYKARAVLTCVRTQLVNTLVIDSEIAEYLLTH